MKSFTALLCVCFAMSAFGKLGETVPQVVKRFGKNYTLEDTEVGKTYKFRSANVSVDVVVSSGQSICETYFSDHPLTTSGEPPNDIVRAVLRTNVPKARWIEIEAAPFSADYALRSADGKYIAILTYTGPQPENMIWTMTVGLEKSVYAVVAARSTDASPAPVLTPSPSLTPAKAFDPDRYRAATSNFETGLRYYNGDGVEKDLSEAAKWFRKAAEGDYGPGQNSLGECYYYGQGVPKDYVEAVKWFRRAAEQNVTAAKLSLGAAYYYGLGVGRNYTEAAKWFRRAAEQNDALAEFMLAVCYYGALKPFPRTRAHARERRSHLAPFPGRGLLVRLRRMGNSSRDEADSSVIRKITWLAILKPFSGHFPLWRQK